MRAWLLGACLAGAMAVPPAPKTPRNTQVQAARQFLAAALRGDTIAAKQWLSTNLRASDVRHVLSALSDAGRRRGASIELYQLGFLMGDDSAQPFVAYAWAADSAVARPLRASIQVVFRDTAARQVWEVYVREIKQK